MPRSLSIFNPNILPTRTHAAVLDAPSAQMTGRWRPTAFLTPPLPLFCSGFCTPAVVSISSRNISKRCPLRPLALRMVQATPSPMDPPAARKEAVVTEAMIATANTAADAAREVIHRYFRRSDADLGISHKSDQSPVTLADQEIEAAIREIITNAFPTHGILGEEEGKSGHAEGDSAFVWVIDPIDGTKAFISGRPTFGTLIALSYEGAPVLGIIDQPITRERWLGVEGRQTTLNGAPVSVAPSNGQGLKQKVVQATTPEMFVGLDAIAFRKLRAAAKGVVYGSDCYAYAMLASGCADLVVEADLKPWDFMALVPVVQGAGGLMCDWSGQNVELWSDGRVVAAGSETVLVEAVQILAVVNEAEQTAMSSKRTYVSEPLAAPVSSRSKASGNGLPEDPGPGHVESMTGFGTAVEEARNVLVRAEIRSVNSRYCDVQVRGPRYLSPFDSEITAIVKQGASRGKLVVSLDVTLGSRTSGSQSTRELPVTVDSEAARAVRDLLDQVAEASGVAPEPTLANVLSFSEVLVRKEPDSVTEHVLKVAKAAVSSAVEDLRAARRREGFILELDLMKRTRKIRELLEEIQARAPERAEKEKNRLEQITKGLDHEGVSESRLEYEITLFADRVDITEETVRLQAHIQLFELTFLGADEPIGTRLSFLLQEMHRETTTIGAKASDAAIAHLVVLIKEEIEKIREQCQNIR